MTEEQYNHWKEFSLAMARGGWERMTDGRRQRLTDEVASWFYWREFQKDWGDMVDWDGSGGTHCVTDHVFEFYCDKYVLNDDESMSHCRFFEQICACLRAGLDVASKQSAGVIGFTIGDIRRMFAGSIPDWVDEAYEGKLKEAQDGDHVWL